MSYDQAITIFSPDGQLLQVEYAAEAAKKGFISSGVRGKDCVVLCVEKRTHSKLRADRSARKLMQLDEHLVLAFSGLQADARVLVDKARMECQNFRLNMEDTPGVDYIAKHIAKLQQQFTIRGGMRPFGLNTLIGGFDSDGRPHLLQSEPQGILSGWKACAIGRNCRPVADYLERNYAPDLGEVECVDLIVKAILEVVEATAHNMEIVVIRKNPDVSGAACGQIEYLSEGHLEAVCQKVAAK